jgi:ATP-dependent DNA helicase PIF1
MSTQLKYQTSNYLYCNQKTALEFMLNKNIFLTGPAGSGKTFLIKTFVEYCNKINRKVAVTAMTGSAAYLIKGRTLHSWAGIKLGKESPEKLVENIFKNFRSRVNWKYVDTLIIDEVSMLTQTLFEKLDYIARKIRGNDNPFGGIQIIVSGDFCQLPPIEEIDLENNKDYCFKSPLWNYIFSHNVCLNCIYRQDDKTFQKILNKIRIGKVDDKINKILFKCTKKKIDKYAAIQPTKLFPYKKDVELINKKHLLKLKNNIITHDIKTEIIELSNNWNKTDINYQTNLMNNNNPYVNKLEICIGAQVMLNINLKQELGLINGSRGVIVGIQENTYYPEVEFMNGLRMIIEPYIWENEVENKGIIKITQIPLVLSWCMSIHKSQGLSLDCVKIDIGKKIFEYGQAYVALSRVRSLCLEPEEGKNEGLYISAYSPDKIKCHKDVLNFYNRFI